MNIPKPKHRPWIVKNDKQIWGNPKDQKIYKSARWRRVREIVLSDEPFCKECKKEGKRTVAIIVDHIKPIRDGGETWDRDNLQSLCIRHHNAKTAKESNQ